MTAALLATLGLLQPMPFSRSQVGRRTGVLRPTCNLQFMRWNLTIYFSRTCYLQFLRWNHTHYFSRTFLWPQKCSERVAVAAATRKMTGGGCGGQGMRPLLCSQMRLAPALALPLAARGLEELFLQLCCCVSFYFWWGIGFGFTYLCT